MKIRTVAVTLGAILGAGGIYLAKNSSSNNKEAGSAPIENSNIQDRHADFVQEKKAPLHSLEQQTGLTNHAEPSDSVVHAQPEKSDEGTDQQQAEQLNSNSAPEPDEQKAERLMDLARDEKSPFTKNFDIEKTSCTGAVCSIEASAHPGASPGDASAVMKFIAAHPEYGTNWNITLGEGRKVTFSLSAAPFDK